MATLTLNDAIRKHWVIVSCLVAAFGFCSVSSKWVKSSLDTNDDWRFLTRFCFLSKAGRFDYTFHYPVSYGIQQLMLYYDSPGQWESVYKSSKNCSTRRAVLSKVNNQIIDLTNQLTDSRNAGCTVYKRNGVDYYNCTDHVVFQSSRERWWYIVAARCGLSQQGKQGLKLEYTIHMMNGEDDDYLHHELSADEFYILPVDIAFLIVFFILLILSIICAVILVDRQQFHTTYKMYVTALALWMFGLFLQCIAWGRYGETGWQEKPTEVTGRVFQAASTEIFLLMLLLMAKGYTITRGRLTQMSAVRLTVFFCLYTIVNITLFIWEGQFFDEGLVLYFYESPPGYGMIAMRLIGWLWFCYAFFFTMKHHPDKAKFYVPFFIFYTAWFWAGPIVIVVAINAIAKWSREKTVNGVEQFVALCGYLFFLILTRPSAANKNFPYHLRVSQVRFSDDDEEPSERYGMSEESRQHLDNMFTVSGSSSATAFSATTPSVRHTTSSESNGHVNNGFVSQGKSQNGLQINYSNGSALPTDTHYTSPNGSPPPSYNQVSRLPPISNHGQESLPLENNGHHGLPPIRSRGPILQETEQEEPSPPPPPPPPGLESDAQANSEALPPLRGQQLPPLNGSRPVPAIFNTAVPSAPPLTEE